MGKAGAAMGPDPTKISVIIHRATGLKGGDWFGKADPYCICELSEHNKFQTKVLSGAGNAPVWNHGPVDLDYHGEPEIHFTVMDKDMWPKKDDELGKVTLKRDQFLQGFDGDLSLGKDKGTLSVRVGPGATDSST